MATTIKLRRGTAAQWTTANPVLSSGEQGYETDTGLLKIGDGATAWTTLPYFINGTSSGISILYMGIYDASGGTFPADGGSGVAGPTGIKRGNMFIFSEGGIIDGQFWPKGTITIALVNNPGQDVTKWNLK